MRNLLVFIFFFCACAGYSQSYTGEYWSSIGFSKKVIKKTRLNLETGFRFEDVAKNNTALFELGLARILPKKFKLEVSYRYSAKSTIERKFRRVHRTSISLSKGYKIKKIKFSVMSKYQWEIKNRTSAKNNDLTDIAWRNKIKVTEKVYKKTQLFFGVELFAFESNNLINRYRYFGGVKYKIKKKIELNLKGIYETMLHNPNKSGMLSLSYVQKI